MTIEIKIDHDLFERENQWLAGQDKVSGILQNGFEARLERLPNFEVAFQLRDRKLRCIDERTPGGIHLAGSGILLARENPQKLIDFCQSAQIEAVTWHSDCGAAGQSVEEMALRIETDVHAQHFSSILATRLGLPLEEENLLGERGFHAARAIYYDGTGHFDPSRLEGLPSGFVISRSFLDPEYALRELGISRNIAMSEHGFGSKFENTPLLVIAIADGRNNSVGSLTDEIRDRIGQGNKTQVLGYTHLED